VDKSSSRAICFDLDWVTTVVGEETVDIGVSQQPLSGTEPSHGEITYTADRGARENSSI